MKIKLHIERVVLMEGMGISSSQRPIFQFALGTELLRLLRGSGLSPELKAGGSHALVRAGTVQIARKSNPKHFGKDIANSVCQAIGDKEIHRSGNERRQPAPGKTNFFASR
jgi:hypothetical protein